MPISRPKACSRITSEDVLESQLDVAGVQCGGLDEREVVLAYARAQSAIALTGIIDCLLLLANCFASSVGTALRCLKSLLFPTSMITMLLSAWSLSSFSHLVTFSYV